MTRWVLFAPPNFPADQMKDVAAAWKGWEEGPVERPFVMSGFRLIDIETGREYPTQPAEVAPVELSSTSAISLPVVVLVVLASALSAVLGFMLGVLAGVVA